MELQEQALMALRVVGAAFLGSLIGWEREKHGRDAGVRTYAAVALGSCVFAIISVSLGVDRIAAGVVTGVGFIGAGVIMQQNKDVKNLTTAASILIVAAISVAVALNAFIVASAVTLLTLAVNIGLTGLEKKIKNS